MQLAITKDHRLIDEGARDQGVFDGGGHDLAARGQHDQGPFTACQIQIAVPVKTSQVASM
jgi:hypothetical protein